MSPMEAEYIFNKYGIPNSINLSKEDLKKSWKNLAKMIHPDRNPNKKEEMTRAIQDINSAYDVLKNIPSRERSNNGYGSGDESWPEQQDYDDYFAHNTHQQYSRQRRNSSQSERPTGWSQAGWNGGAPNSSNIFNKDFSDLNYCKKTAWEISGRPPFDREHEYTFINWDGSYFRGVFSVYAIPEKLFEISKMMTQWDNWNRSVAVFCYRKIDNYALLVNLRGQKVNPPKEIKDFEPNDQQFRDYLRNNL